MMLTNMQQFDFIVFLQFMVMFWALVMSCHVLYKEKTLLTPKLVRVLKAYSKIKHERMIADTSNPYIDLKKERNAKLRY